MAPEGRAHDTAVVEDRQRIATDLHDRVIQRLFAVGLGIEAISARLSDPVATERLQQMVADLDETIREVRGSIFELRCHNGQSTYPATD